MLGTAPKFFRPFVIFLPVLSESPVAKVAGYRQEYLQVCNLMYLTPQELKFP